MKVKNKELSDIRKEYGKEDSPFFIRIREDNKYDKDIVYYNGIKAFEMKKDSNRGTEKSINTIINLPDNIYNFNKTNIEDHEKTILKAISKLRDDMKSYFVKEIESIVVKMSYSRYKREKKEDINNAIDNIINNINKEIHKKGYDRYINLDNEIAKNIKNEFEKKYKEQQKKEKMQGEKFKGKDLIYSIPVNDVQCKTYIKDITEIEFLFIRYFIFDENMTYRKLFKKPDFKPKNRQCEIDKAYYKDFEENIKKAIEQYEKLTGEEAEKKYQHLFMKSKILTNKLKEFKDIYRFEEEYSTSEGRNSEEKGRIDCVFAKIDENNTTDSFNTEIYLIELKVDAGVIDGTNGVNKHLIDIENLKKSNNFDKFIHMLENRICKRIKILEGKEQKIKINLNPNKIHFWTIIAISNEKCAKEVAEKLIKLTKEYEVKKEREKGLLPKNCVVLDKQIEKLRDSGVDVKFLFDKNIPNELSYTYLLEHKGTFKRKTIDDFLKEWKRNSII